MAKIPVGFRCSTDRFKESLRIEENLNEVNYKIEKTINELRKTNYGSKDHKDLINTLNQLEKSHKNQKTELKSLEDNKTQFIKTSFSIPKKKGKKKKSIQQVFKEMNQEKKLKDWDSIQAKARKKREDNQNNTKKSQQAKQKAIADRRYANELTKMDESFKQFSGMDLNGEYMKSEGIEVFISHASEDKDSIVRELADSLISEGVKVWYDEYSLSIGDSLSSSINKGLSECTFGIVILSPNFTKKRWPEVELQSLYTKEVHKGKTILPIWHRITFDEVMDFNLHLADKFAFNSAIHSVDAMTKAIIKELDKKLTEYVV